MTIIAENITLLPCDNDNCFTSIVLLLICIIDTNSLSIHLDDAKADEDQDTGELSKTKQRDVRHPSLLTRLRCCIVISCLLYELL